MNFVVAVGDKAGGGLSEYPEKGLPPFNYSDPFNYSKI